MKTHTIQARANPPEKVYTLRYYHDGTYHVEEITATSLRGAMKQLRPDARFVKMIDVRYA